MIEMYHLFLCKLSDDVGKHTLHESFLFMAKNH